VDEPELVECGQRGANIRLDRIGVGGSQASLTLCIV
jgi:hypothetical protein